MQSLVGNRLDRVGSKQVLTPRWVVFATVHLERSGGIIQRVDRVVGSIWGVLCVRMHLKETSKWRIETLPDYIILIDGRNRVT